MRKISVLFVAAFTFCFVASVSFGGGILSNATIKSVDETTGSIVLKADDKEHVIKADANVDLSKVKPGDVVNLKTDQGLHLGQYNSGDKVEFEFVKGILKSIKFHKTKDILK